MQTITFTLLVCLLFASSTRSAPSPAHHPFERIIELINSSPGSTWKAGHNFDASVSEDVIADMCGSLPDPKPLELREPHPENTVVPDSFDARDDEGPKGWGKLCPSVKEVRDQGACGSCWAFGAVEAMTDRFCIASNGEYHPHISAEDLMTCCGFECGFGCNGGFPSGAWRYYEGDGIVTGGQYASNKGCQPYQVKSCSHHVVGEKPPCGATVSTPECKSTCREGYNTTYEEDKKHGVSSYSVHNNEEQIKKEIFTHGPVEGAFTVYADFPTYKSGVYQHVHGRMLGGHAIRVLGWGVENGVKYWIVANSWNPTWGDQGFFKILRGSNHCGIESGIVAGLPKTTN